MINLLFRNYFNTKKKYYNIYNFSKYNKKCELPNFYQKLN